MRQRVDQLESGAQMAELRDEVKQMTKELDARCRSEEGTKRHAAFWQERAEESRTALEEASSEREELRAGVELDLGGGRVLCVGGRNPLTCHYRSVVERFNGELIHGS